MNTTVSNERQGKVATSVPERRRTLADGEDVRPGIKRLLSDI